jgi:subtilase family serine protease
MTGAPYGKYGSTDFHAAYASCTTLDGTGQGVGLVEFDGFTDSDITIYAANTHLPNGGVAVTRVPGTPTSAKLPVSGNSNSIESALDIEGAMAMAPGLSRIYVYETPIVSGEVVYGAAGLNAILSNMAFPPNGIPRSFQLSSSWGGDRDETTSRLLLEIAAQGQSFFLATQDGGTGSDLRKVRHEGFDRIGAAATMTVSGEHRDDERHVAIVGIRRQSNELWPRRRGNAPHKSGCLAGRLDDGDQAR